MFPLANRATMKATVVLLPLLGLTWVFGILTIDQNTTVFAWLFTVCNSIQVGSSLCTISSPKYAEQTTSLLFDPQFLA